MVAGSSRVNALLGSVVFMSFQAEASTTHQRQLSSKPNILVACWNLAVTCPLECWLEVAEPPAKKARVES